MTLKMLPHLLTLLQNWGVSLKKEKKRKKEDSQDSILTLSLLSDSAASVSWACNEVCVSR